MPRYFAPIPVMERRQKPSMPLQASSLTTLKTVVSRLSRLSRRLKYFPLAQLLATTEAVYAILSICLLVLVFFIISFLDERSTTPTLFSSQSSSGSIPFIANISATLPTSEFSAFGSTKQLDYLIRNITNRAHVVSNSSSTSLIVAIAVNYAYRKLALNFICNLNRLKIANYVVLAMDRPVFDYLALRDAHVFWHDDRFLHKPLLGSQSNSKTKRLSRHLNSISSLKSTGNGLHGNAKDAPDSFGSHAFVETSRRKSVLVLRLLSLGYSVLFSDVDVVWVTNPIQHMLKQSGHFVIQSDRPAALPDAPLNYNINSGLYLARATPQTIIAMRAILKYSHAIRRSEQKAFNFVLCGAFKDQRGGPGSRVGTTECMYNNAETTAQVLPLDAFPNGSDDSLWNTTSNFLDKYPSVVAVHANYVADREGKERRIRNIGFWFHSEKSQTRNECQLPQTS